MTGKPYEIVYKKSVDKDLRSLSSPLRTVIVAKILELAADPHPPSSTRLRGSVDLFRLRHADYRIIYQVSNQLLRILIIKVGHRRDVYKDF